MNLLSLEDISKSYGVAPLFQGVTFGIEEGEKTGLIGLNGAGKSTLLRIIAGREPPDSGRVVTANQRRVGYLPQNPPFVEERTVLDTIFTTDNERLRLLHDYEAACHDLALAKGHDELDDQRHHERHHERLMDRVARLADQLEAAGGWDLETNARTVLTQLGITDGVIDTGATMGALSGGERKRVMLARALISNPDLLLLDEPTNHLDADTIAWLETYLARYSGAILLITHDRYFLDRVTGRILEIDRQAVQSFAGNYAYYVEKKADLEARRVKANERRETQLRRELAWLKRGARARRTKEKARIKHVEQLSSVPIESVRGELDIAVGFSRMGKKILELERVSKRYDDRPVVANFSYTLKRDDRIGIIGPNGAGKTTLLDIIAGQIQPDAGSVETGQTIVIGYYDQENRELNPAQRVIDYIREAAEQIETADGQVITATQMLERFLFPAAMQYDVIGRLSGGERRRLYLLRVLMGAPNVLLMDEPTNDLDIQTLARLEEYLDSFAGCLIVVSHDRYFLDRTVESIFRFEGAGIIREYPGNYSAFLEAREQQAQQSAQPVTRSIKPAAAASAAAGTARKLSFKERREYEELESRISQAEARKGEIERQMAASPSDFVLVHALTTELDSLNRQLDRDVDRWGELAELA